MKRQSVVILLYFLIIASFSNYSQAQITIGSAAPPVNGALLQLKERAEDSIGTNANRGLILPRLNLTILRGDLATTIGQTAGSLDNNNHIGLLIYNVKTQGFPDRICPGVHVWNGIEWSPLKAYPQVPNSLAGPTANLVDTRGSETNTYRTARFYSVVIDPCQEGVATIIDAGIWMTENLNTRYMPNGTAITQGTGSNYVIRSYSVPTNTGADAARIKANGLFYNWAAATNQKGGTGSGQDNVDNIAGGGVANDEVGTGYAGQNQLVRQGICPNGWHLPSDAEWLQLVQAIQLQPELYSTQTTANATNIGNAFKSPDEPYSNASYRGTSKPVTQGGFTALLPGFANSSVQVSGYGISSFFWTSSSSSSNGLNAWKHLLRYDNSIVEHSGSTRTNLFSVRCKKN